MISDDARFIGDCIADLEKTLREQQQPRWQPVYGTGGNVDLVAPETTLRGQLAAERELADRLADALAMDHGRTNEHGCPACDALRAYGEARRDG